MCFYLVRFAAAIVMLGLASQISIPISPVPLTLQSFAVLGVGVWLGPGFGFAAVVAWLALSGLGLPLLAEGKSGLSGPTLGYLAAMPLAAAMAGASPRLHMMLAAHAVILLAGAGWLATLIGPDRALSAGVLPFLPGAIVKSVAAALLAAGLRKRAQSANQSA